ncbi:MAG: hypothetical protein IPK79_04670 [Vampirovibrionales bacterium]|nr:hypothetical protein [Vampirovibrionales bacterium]
MGNASGVCNAFLNSATPYASAPPSSASGRDPGGDFVNQFYGTPFGARVSPKHDACMRYCIDVTPLGSDVAPQDYGLTDPASQCR